jgi:hypothetical protein
MIKPFKILKIWRGKAIHAPSMPGLYAMRRKGKRAM